MTTNSTDFTDFVWNAFESTGSISAYSFYKEIGEKNKVLQERQTAEDEVAISF